MKNEDFKIDIKGKNVNEELLIELKSDHTVTKREMLIALDTFMSTIVDMYNSNLLDVILDLIINYYNESPANLYEDINKLYYRLNPSKGISFVSLEI